MDVVLNKDTGIPLYIQLENQLIYLIKKGSLRVGDKVPTERELSKQLNISRNTVSMAYNELEDKGVLKSIRGKGTFVVEEGLSWKSDDSRKKVGKFVDLALDEALESGIELDDFLEMVSQRIAEKREVMHKINAVFIECNEEQAKMYSKEIAAKTGMNVVPMTLSDMDGTNDYIEKLLSSSQVIVAPYNHVNDIKALMKDNQKEILGVDTNVDLGSFVKIARHPKGTKFFFICISDEFMFKMKTALLNAGLGDINIDFYNGNSHKEIEQFIDKCEVIIATPGRYKEIRAMNKDEKELIQFSYTLDSESIKTLKYKVMDLKYENK